MNTKILAALLLVGVLLVVVGNVAGQEDSDKCSLDRLLSLLVDFNTGLQTVASQQGASSNVDAILNILGDDIERLVAFNAECGSDAGQTDVVEAQVIPASDTFQVIANGVVNLRSCSDTTCDLVGQTGAGESLTVVQTHGDWYEIQRNNGTAFVAGWLTTRLPENVIEVGEAFIDDATNCGVLVDQRRGSMDINIILMGSARDDVIVDLYRPNENVPLQVQGQLDKTFIDTGDPYIHQYYSFSVGWPFGLYQLEITQGGESTMVAFDLQERGDYNIFVGCE